MKAFVHRLVARLLDREQPLSRNRHFHAFDNPDGRKALKISRQLRSLARDIVEQERSGKPLRVVCERDGAELVRVQLDFLMLKATRTAFLSPQEFDLLMRDHEVRAVIERAQAA
ncbi:MAG: hypothetical protein ACK4N5_15740 [Myxococcales bacterium]